MINQLLKIIAKVTASTEEVLSDILMFKFTIVNAFILRLPQKKWVLVDTGLENSFEYIVMESEERFGKAASPEAIVLTHGHFDHTGSVIRLAERWDVPVYAHAKELPYITGKMNYPQGDPTTDEGLVAKMSSVFPHESIDLGFRAVALPPDGSIPGVSGWKWIHTPGHTEGHISLFRERDKTLIAGDAVTTTKQESLFPVLTKKEQIKGPPAYLTPDWAASKESVDLIRTLVPQLLLPSHGKPIAGKELEEHLLLLTEHFNEIAIPESGRYIEH
jgi:glyoxylase-like metal-dependent hydrolase (beta-lactamase superfamily II)